MSQLMTPFPRIQTDDVNRISVSSLFSVGAIFCLGQAIQTSNGTLNPLGIRYLAAGFVCLIVCVSFGDNLLNHPSLSRTLGVLGGTILIWQLAQLASASPGIYLRNVAFPDYAWRLVIFASLIASLLSGRPWLGKFHRWAALAAFGVLGVWLLKASPNPFIDVYAWTHYALEALGRGQNPYEIWMPNIYHHTLWFDPKLADNDWVKTGYAYPPLSLLVSGLGYLAGDMRWANLGLMLLTGACLFSIHGRFALLAGALYLTTPRILFVLEQSWTDTYVVGLIAATVWSACRLPSATPYLFGLTVVSKQYTLFVVPLALLLIPRPWSMRATIIWTIKAITSGLAVTGPFLLWNARAMLDSLMITGHPFRPESLSFLAATAKNGQPTFPLYIQFALLIPAYALIAWRAPKTPAGFALSAGLVYSVFFSFSKHAFCNHHFLVLGCACIALAATDSSSRAKNNSGEVVSV